MANGNVALCLRACGERVEGSLLRIWRRGEHHSPKYAPRASSGRSNRTAGIPVASRSVLFEAPFSSESKWRFRTALMPAQRVVSARTKSFQPGIPRCNLLTRGSFAASGFRRDVVRRGDREDALIAAGQQHPFQQAAALVVEEIFVPVILDHFGNDHQDAPVRMLFR